MNEFVLVLLGIACALIVALIAYPSQVFIKMRTNRNKINNIFAQIKGQVDIKHTLLKEYIEINKDSIGEEKFNIINEKINSYKMSVKNVDTLKDYNDMYAYYMKSFDDNLLINQCNESEEKINHIKEYYNELVYFYNRYKASPVNSFLAKALSIEDEKLY